MTRFIKSILCVAAVLGLPSSALAQLPAGTAYFIMSNWDNGYYNWQGPNFTNPNATTDGALWIQTGTAAPVWLDQDVNLRLDWRPNSGAAWTTITTLLTTPPSGYTRGTAWNCTGAYAGYFLDASGPGNDQGLPSSPGAYYQSAGQYFLPGTSTIDRNDWTQFQFDLSAWTGTATTFPAAVAAGAQVADSGAFFANPGTDGFSSAGYAIDAIGDMNPLNHGAFYYMPAVVLKTSLPGDANLDGRVDINDLTIVLANYGQTGMEWSQGEFTGDGTVDINDLTIVLAHYGQTAGAPGPAVDSSVPEPSALLLAAAALAGGLAYAGRRQLTGGGL